MKKILIASFAIAALVFTGCNKMDNEAPAGRTVRITADVAQMITRVNSNTAARFTWQENDAIGVWTGSGLTKFTLDPEWAGFGYGEFVGELPEGGVINENSYAVYPYNEDGEATAAAVQGMEISKWELPAKFVNLYAQGATEVDGKYAFQFHHATAYFRVTLKNVPATGGGLYIETADGGCYTTSVKYDFSGETPTLDYAVDESVIYVLPDHTGAIEQVDLVIAIKPGTYAQRWGQGGLKFRIAVYSEPNWWSTKIFDHAGYFLPAEGAEGYTITAGEYYVFPAITYPNLKEMDDSGSGVNDGIEEGIVTTQDPDGFWNISLN